MCVAGGDGQAFDAFHRQYFPRPCRLSRTRVDDDPEPIDYCVERTLRIVVRDRTTCSRKARKGHPKMAARSALSTNAGADEGLLRIIVGGTRFVMPSFI